MFSRASSNTKYLSLLTLSLCHEPSAIPAFIFSSRLAISSLIDFTGSKVLAGTTVADGFICLATSTRKVTISGELKTPVPSGSRADLATYCQTAGSDWTASRSCAVFYWGRHESRGCWISAGTYSPTLPSELHYWCLPKRIRRATWCIPPTQSDLRFRNGKAGSRSTRSTHTDLRQSEQKE